MITLTLLTGLVLSALMAVTFHGLNYLETHAKDRSGPWWFIKLRTLVLQTCGYRVYPVANGVRFKGIDASVFVKNREALTALANKLQFIRAILGVLYLFLMAALYM